jgi:pyruvate dehydrogenase E2 component (dihydrolipoamide acetyltransferase)
MPERVFLLPDPGEGLEEAEVVSWLVAEGDEVVRNQPLVEIETAKASVEIPSPWAGTVTRLHAAEGQTVAVGAPLVGIEVKAGDGKDAAPHGSRSSVAATPAVRRLAKDLGVDLSSVEATGPDGRVTAADVRGTARPENDVEEVPLTAVRRTLARRLETVALVPQVTTFRRVDCLHLEAFRRELGVSPLTVVVVALARVVRDRPLLNAAWGRDRIRLFGAVNVGIAVDTPNGLLVPVVRSAETLGIADVGREIDRLAESARLGRLAQEDAVGATIAVSNTGSYGSEAGTPLLNPGCAVTLALGVIQPQPLVVEGDVVARPACTLSMTFDHRVMDGAPAGNALTDLVARLQDPARLRDLPR